MIKSDRVQGNTSNLFSEFMYQYISMAWRPLDRTDDDDG